MQFNFSFHSRVRIDDVGSLVIQYARKEDHGRYQCSAKNLAATRDSRPIRLKVHGKFKTFPCCCALSISTIHLQISKRFVLVQKSYAQNIFKLSHQRTALFFFHCTFILINKKQISIFEVFNRRIKDFPWDVR